MHRSPDFNPPEKASTHISTDNCFVMKVCIKESYVIKRNLIFS